MTADELRKYPLRVNTIITDGIWKDATMRLAAPDGTKVGDLGTFVTPRLYNVRVTGIEERTLLASFAFLPSFSAPVDDFNT